MSLIIFANIMAGLQAALISSVTTRGNIVLTVVTVVDYTRAIIQLIVYIERGQLIVFLSTMPSALLVAV